MNENNSPAEKHQVQVTQEDIRNIKKEVEHIATKLDIVHDALIGNPIAKDGGLVKRITDAEIEIKKVSVITRSNKIYLNLLWCAAGGLVMAIIGLITRH